MRSCGSSSSPIAHITFCTLTEVLRPQILIIRPPLWMRSRSIQAACFLGQHDRNAVADGIGELCGARDQLLLLGVVFERALGQRADQYFEQLRVNRAGWSLAGRGGHDVLRDSAGGA